MFYKIGFEKNVSQFCIPLVKTCFEKIAKKVFFVMPDKMFQKKKKGKSYIKMCVILWATKIQYFNCISVMRACPKAVYDEN